MTKRKPCLKIIQLSWDDMEKLQSGESVVFAEGKIEVQIVPPDPVEPLRLQP